MKHKRRLSGCFKSPSGVTENCLGVIVLHGIEYDSNAESLCRTRLYEYESQTVKYTDSMRRRIHDVLT